MFFTCSVIKTVHFQFCVFSSSVKRSKVQKAAHSSKLGCNKCEGEVASFSAKRCAGIAEVEQT